MKCKPDDSKNSSKRNCTRTFSWRFRFILSWDWIKLDIYWKLVKVVLNNWIFDAMLMFTAKYGSTKVAFRGSFTLIYAQFIPPWRVMTPTEWNKKSSVSKIAIGVLVKTLHEIAEVYIAYFWTARAVRKWKLSLKWK